jgi:hypothetical protein
MRHRPDAERRGHGRRSSRAAMGKCRDGVDGASVIPAARFA